mgnify:CR=1 FL=1
MGRYANTRFNNNLNEIIFDGVGPYDIPIIRPEQYEPINFIGFNYSKSISKQSIRQANGIHFFVDDYQFERIWGSWKKYGAFLSQFNAVCTPDFSLYTDWPKAVQIFNHYRKHFIGAYLQELGVKVYPTIAWSDADSFEWCFDGEPKNATVVVSSIGTQNSISKKSLFLNGYNEMLKRLQPKTILFYGNIPAECSGGNIIKIEPFISKFKRGDCNV